MHKLFKDLTGQKFNKLTVIELHGKENGRYIWKCQCDCGNFIFTIGCDLKRSRPKSCGCYNGNQLGKNSNKYKGYEDISACFWSGVKKCAKRRKIEFNITIKDAWNQYIKQNKKCALTKQYIYFSPSKSTMYNLTTASLDRIDSNKPYNIDNIQWVHKIINKMKMDIENNKFIELCKLITKNNA